MSLPIEIFRAGRHVSMDGSSVDFGDSDLDQIIGSYDPAVHEAPIVVGHPSTNGPAYGWVTGMRRSSAGVLEASVDRVDEAFAELVRAGRYKKVSASFYRPGAATNPKPGSWYLRHVGFLGAQPPAVKGLRDASFADGESEGDFIQFAEVDAVGFLGALRELLTKQLGEEAVRDAFAAAAEADPQDENSDGAGAEPKGAAPGSESPVDPGAANLSEADREIARREERIALLERDLEERQREQRRREQLAFCEQLVSQGRPLPCKAELLCAFMEALEATPADAVSFGEGERRSGAELFREELLAKLPKQAHFAELSADHGEGGANDAASIAKRAAAYQSEQLAKGVHLSTTDAVRHVRKAGGS